MKGEFEAKRHQMVQELIEAREVRCPRVLEALREVPREAFLPSAFVDQAYADGLISLDAEHCLPSPVQTARMLEALGAAALDRALVVGDGTGYPAALLRRLCGRVTAVTRHPAMAGALRATLARTRDDDVHVVVRDESGGFGRHAPYEAILVVKAAPDVPDPFVEQLSPGGRLVLALGSEADDQLLYRFHLDGYELERIELGPVRFAPLLGRHGFSADPIVPWS